MFSRTCNFSATGISGLRCLWVAISVMDEVMDRPISKKWPELFRNRAKISATLKIFGAAEIFSDAEIFGAAETGLRKNQANFSSHTSD